MNELTVIGNQEFNLDGVHNKMWTSLQPEKKSTIFKAMTNSDYNFETIPAGFELENILLHEIELITEEGEVIKQIRTVLVDKTGKTAGFCSNGIKKAVMTLASVYGPPPWVPALKIKIKMVKTRGGFKAYNIEVLD